MTKQVVLITGCSKGGIGNLQHLFSIMTSFWIKKIGYALAKRFAEEGNHVIATTRKLDALEGLEGI